MARPVPRLKERSSCTDKHDSLGWETGFSVRAESQDPSRPFGSLSVGIRTNEPALLPEFRELLPAHWPEVEAEEVDLLFSFLAGSESNRRGTRNYNLAYVGCTRTFRSLDLREALGHFQELIYAQVTLRLPLPALAVLVKSRLAAAPERLVASIGEPVGRLDGIDLLASSCPCLLLDSEGRVPEEFCDLMGLAGPLTDLVFRETHAGSLSPGQATLSLFRHCYANNGADHLLEILARVVQATRLHFLPLEERVATAQP